MPSACGQGVGRGSASFDRFCLAAGIETLGAMMEADAEWHMGHGIRAVRTCAVILGHTQDKTSFRAGQLAVERPGSAGN
jgi:hypothetical protein